MKNNHVKVFESWLNEAVSKASNEDIQRLLNLLIPIIKKVVSDVMRFELEYAKRLSAVDNDNERSKIFLDLNTKREVAEKPISMFLSSKAKTSQFEMEKILSWSKTMLYFLIDKEMYSMKEEFKALGIDVSKWEEMYDQNFIMNQIVLHNKYFEQQTGIKPPLVM